ncbi:hypothetical protein [Paractinoplanes toevensis]|uniref:Uncharacterized protein n=1 Tax=Paractinoplanes toevensis TaxID=571911 RepID=A0A919T737_9ACTN|nr:hypothetical protein [Actinoplanes toevensis]GIM90353.1 hypothetical protein Ato02nite_021460 [Actinoplanes toevensis]
MTPPQILTFIVGVWLVGSGIGAGLFLLLGRRIYGRGVEHGRRLTEVAHSWRGEPVVPPVPRRRWSRLDRKQAPAPQPRRPVFHDS